MGQTSLLRRSILLILLFILVVLYSCKKEQAIDGNEYKVYTISNHKSTYDVNKAESNTVSGYAMFTSSCEYELEENIGQINKLVGLSSGIYHQINSIRIGWEYDEVFKLYAYYYIDGDRDQKYITSVETGEKFSFVMSIGESSYDIVLNHEFFSIPHNITERKTSYILYPYFGGKEPFPGSIYGDKKCRIYLSYKL